MGDRNWSSDSVLFLFNGTDGSTSTPDSGPNNLTAAGINNASLSTTNPKYGTACLNFPNAGLGQLLAANAGNAVFNRTGDLTDDYWAKWTDASTKHPITTVNDADSYDGWYAVAAGLSGEIRLFRHGPNNTITSASSGFNTGVWRHVALTRAGSTVRLYVDGVHQGSATDSTVYGDSAAKGIPAIGVWYGDGSHWLGQLDCFRITKGLARWTGTSSFTPPQSESAYLPGDDTCMFLSFTPH